MNRDSHIKTHFDARVILSFIAILLISGGILAFRVNENEPCNVEKFEIQASSFKVGELITFSDYTDNAHEWKWDFGDGSEVSFRSKVAHEYKKPGKYLVNLWVNKNCNIAKMVEIKSNTEVLDSSLLPRFSAPKIAYVGESISFKDSTAHAKSWEWRFGERDNKIDAIDQNPTYSYTTPGEKTISLFVNDDMKHVSFKKITVFPSRKEKTAITKAEVMKETTDPVEEYLRTIPEGPVSELNENSVTLIENENEEETKEKITVPSLDEGKLAGLIMGLAENKLRYANFKRYFCEDYLPRVQLKDGRVVSLYYLNNTIRGKKIELRNVSMVRSKENNCVSLIILDYKKKGLF